MKQAKDKLLERMQREKGSISFLSQYIAWVASEWPDEAQKLEDDLIKTFSTEEGLRTLILLTKSTVEMATPNGSPESALREINAVRNFVLEIRRIVAHGTR